jgi:hypothetical protein
METSEEISGKQAQLIALLLTERTIDDACKKANVSVSTYWRWMKEPNFLTEYRSTRSRILENTVAKLQSLSTDAIEALERNLHCENPSIEIRSATIILEHSAKGVEALNLLVRVEELESIISRLEAGDEET